MYMCSYDDKMCHINDNCKLYFGISSVNYNVWIVILISVFHLDELKKNQLFIREVHPVYCNDGKIIFITI